MTRLPNTSFQNIPAVAHGRRRRTKGVVIHTIEGTDGSAINWFKDRQARGVGAHVVIGQEPNRTIQITDLDNVCYHAVGGNSDWIGFEHEGFAKYTKTQWLKTVNRNMLRRSANRVAWICWNYKLGEPRRGKNIIGHSDLKAGGHHDPGRGWPWWLYIFLAKRAYKNLVKSKGRTWLP